MSRYKTIKTLESLALKKLGDWIAQLAENRMTLVELLSHRDTNAAQSALSETVDCARAYLEYNVPWMVHDQLANEVVRALSQLIEKTKHSLGFRVCMGKFVTQMNVIIRMTEVVFNKYLTTVSIDSKPKMLRQVFYSKLYMLKGLVYLNLGSLSGGWKTADMENSIIESLKNLHFLKYLSMHYDCTDNILRCIVQNCTEIQKLDVSCSKCITNESIDIIMKLKHLRSVQLYRTQVTVIGYVELLLKCINLQDIGTCDEIGKVLEHIDVNYPNPGPFKLTNYVSRYATFNQLQLAVQMFPDIRSMTVFHNTLQTDLMVLISLKDLQDLKLLSCDFYADQIKQVLQVKGCNIVSLHLEHVDQIDLNALMYISQMCPLLENFTLYNCTLIQHTSLYTKKLEILPLRNLKRLTCVATCTNEQLLFILSNCLNVEYVHLGTAAQLTDELVVKILEQNPLIYLKELRIMQSNYLTMLSIDRLIQSCVSLQILVELENWSLLTDSDREYIKKYIIDNNYNIDTTPGRQYDA